MIQLMHGDCLEIVKLYTEDRWTLRRIADKFQTNHHLIHRVLGRHGVVVTRKNRVPLVSGKPRKTFKRGPNKVPVVHSEANNRRNMARKLKTEIDLSAYGDFEKLKFLTRTLSRCRKHVGFSDSFRKGFLDKFYFDQNFNRLYDTWLNTGKNKWWRPSIDHMTPRCREGDWSLDNLQWLSWFENRAKAEMTQEEWNDFKGLTNTQSTLFV